MKITRRNMLKALAVGVGTALLPAVAHGVQDKYDMYSFRASEDIEAGRLLVTSEARKLVRLALPSDIDAEDFGIVVSRHDVVAGEWLSVVTVGRALKAAPQEGEVLDDTWEYTASKEKYTLEGEQREDAPRQLKGWERKNQFVKRVPA